MANVALSPGHAHVRVLRFGVILVGVSVLVLTLIGFTNEFALTILPAVAGLSGLAVEEYNLHRTDHGRPAVHHRLRASLVGFAVFASAMVIAVAT